MTAASLSVDSQEQRDELHYVAYNPLDLASTTSFKLHHIVSLSRPVANSVDKLA